MTIESQRIATEVRRLLDGEVRGKEVEREVMGLLESFEALALLSEALGEPRRLVVLERVFAAMALPLYRGELDAEIASRLRAYAPSFGTASITLGDAEEYVALERLPEALEPAASVFKALVVAVVKEAPGALDSMRLLLAAKTGNDLNGAVARAAEVEDRRVRAAIEGVRFDESLVGVRESLQPLFSCYVDLLEPYEDVLDARAPAALQGRSLFAGAVDAGRAAAAAARTWLLELDPVLAALAGGKQPKYVYGARDGLADPEPRVGASLRWELGEGRPVLTISADGPASGSLTLLDRRDRPGEEIPFELIRGDGDDVWACSLPLDTDALKSFAHGHLRVVIHG